MKILDKISVACIPLCRKYKHILIRSRNYSDEKVNVSTSMHEIIRQKIKMGGPIPVAKFMSDVLTHPTHGYYTTREVIGRDGDFVTSPEISQIFGELIAVWYINEWIKVGAPKPYNFVELGPGRGTLLQDILRVFRQFKIVEALSIHLIEVSEVQSKIQEDTLNVKLSPIEEDVSYYKSGKTEDEINVYWYKSLVDYKYRKFSLIMAHEFFDALPIHKFKRTEKGWREVFVDIDPNDVSGTRFRYVLSPDITPRCKLLVHEDEIRDEFEASLDSVLFMAHLGKKMEAYGGIALVVDYGHCGTKTDTFRAFKNHQQCDPLTNVGEADLTADVDFSLLKRAVTPTLITLGPITQSLFLKNMFIETRFEKLLATCKNREEEIKLQKAYEMLTDDNKMGTCFKFMAFFPAILKDVFKKYPVVGFAKEKRKKGEDEEDEEE